MKAILITAYGGPDVLSVTELPDPVPAAGEVLIRVRAFGLNHAETYMRSGAWGDVAQVPGIRKSMSRPSTSMSLSDSHAYWAAPSAPHTVNRRVLPPRPRACADTMPAPPTKVLVSSGDTTIVSPSRIKAGN